MNGIELSERHYRERVAPGLAGIPHAAALLGPGSEVLGYDDEVSPDHDFGERVLVFRDGDLTVPGFFRGVLGFDPGAGVTVADWLLTPTQLLASLTRGAVFHDPAGELARYRAVLEWYPSDVWRYALAAAWLKVAQEEPFAARTGSTGDELGSRVLIAREVRELVRLAFLVERRWAPYAKWLGRAFGELEVAPDLGPPLAAALDAGTWREREGALLQAKLVLASATDDLGLGPRQGPAVRPFHTRDIRVIDGSRWTAALAGGITDPMLRGVLHRVGEREGVPQVPGTIDQAVDSTDVLTAPARCRAAAAMLGLPGT